ncbi:unnamed protein product [Diabrotica balteata]|uniref:Alpha-tubulin N-acetyltransferase n=1 Tax=Diabrotica balteata TaxID=107213 RepID=A0A9P0DSX0_DIABA|nr:unnamed protein product [Diabrotica balteata]
MEFNYNINEIFKSPIVEINHSLIPPGYTGDRRALRDVVTKVSDIVNAMGEASASAQGLTKPVTTADRLRNSEHKLYFLIDNNANGGRGAVTGMLKTGNKSLYVFDRDGVHYQVAPPCLLDFYIHESRQRNGLGKQLFEYMLQRENVEPVQMAIDRPSEKLLGFFNKHYQLNEPVKQMNNYVVYDGFFPSKEQIAPPEPEIEDARSVTNFKKNSANGLQAFQAPLGRYGAPRPPCSMGQIIHNQSTMDQRKEPAGVQSLPATNYVGTSYSPQTNSYKTQSTPNMYYGNQYQNNLNQYQSNVVSNQAQVDSANIQNVNYQNQNYSYPTSNVNNTYNTTAANVNEYPNQMNYTGYPHQQSGNGKWAMGDSQNVQTDQQYQTTAPTISSARVANGIIDHGQADRSVNKDPLISSQDSRVSQGLNQQHYNPSQMTQSAIYQPTHSTYSVQGLRQPQIAQTVPNLSIQQRYPTDIQQSQTYVNQPNQQNMIIPKETTQTPVASMHQLNQPQSPVMLNVVPQQYTHQQMQQEVKYNPSLVPPSNSFENPRQFTQPQSQQVAAPTQQYNSITPHVQQQNGMGDSNLQNQSHQPQGHSQQQYYSQQVATSGDSRQQYLQTDQNQVTHLNIKRSESTNPIASTVQMSPNVKPELSKTQVPEIPQANYVPGIGEARTEQQFHSPLNAAGQTNLQYSQNQPNWEQNRIGTVIQSAPYNQAEQRNEQSKLTQLPQGHQFNVAHQTVENQSQSVQQFQNNEQRFQNHENTDTSRGLDVRDTFGQNLSQTNNQNQESVQPNYHMMNASNTNTFNTQNHSLPAPKHAEIQQSMGEIHPTSSYQYVQANSGSYRPPQQISSLPNSTQDQNITSTGVAQQSHQTVNRQQSTAHYAQQLRPIGQFQAQGIPVSSITTTDSIAAQQPSIPTNQYQQNYQNQPTTAEANQTHLNINQLSTYQENAQIRPSQHQLNSQQSSAYTQQNIGQYLHNPNSPPQPQAPILMQQHTPVLNTVQGNVSATTAGQIGYQLKQHEQIQPKQAGDYLAQPHSNPSFQGNTAGQVGYQLKQQEQIQPKQGEDYLLAQPHSNPSFQGNTAGQVGYHLKQHEQIQPKQAGEYLAQPHSNTSFHGNINKQTKTTKSAAELFKTNAFQPTSISKLAKRHLNKARIASK